MASDAVFRMFPDPGPPPPPPQGGDWARGGEPDNDGCDEDRFVRKQYPMLYMALKGREHPSIADVRCAEVGSSCPLCLRLDRNTLDSVKVLEPYEVRGYLESYDHRFTEKEVNVHLAHTAAGEENVIGVIKNMSVDLISRSYSVANTASLRVMNRVTTHAGRAFLVPDLDAAKVHNDAVKQFIGLASTCQTLMRCNRAGENNKRVSGAPPTAAPLL